MRIDKDSGAQIPDVDLGKSPSGFSILLRELIRDKVAFGSLLFLFLIRQETCTCKNSGENGFST